MVSPPFDKWCRKILHGGERRRRRLVILHCKIFCDAEKIVDGASPERFARSLSLFGKLFEIYFVRLIGTPNQQFKNGIGFRTDADVSSS